MASKHVSSAVFEDYYIIDRLRGISYEITHHSLYLAGAISNQAVSKKVYLNIPRLRKGISQKRYRLRKKQFYNF